MKLYPVKKNGQFKGKLKAVSHTAIEPIYIPAPSTPVCLMESCNLHTIKWETHDQDIPNITLIKGTTISKKAYSVARKCHQCNTIYYMDHEHSS